VDKVITLHLLQEQEFTQVMPYLQTALEKGGGHLDWSIEDVYDQGKRGDVQVWGFYSFGRLFGAGVSVLYSYPKRTVVEILLMGTAPNTERQWREILIQFGEYARSVGASTLTGAGRRGWARKLGGTERTLFELPVQVVG
jgi:hypothetical protein